MIQFGVFTDNLSTSQQIVLWPGSHSWKAFIRGKPIRFEYKNWVLWTNDVYPFKVIQYQGISINDNQRPLGFRVVKEFLDVVKDGEWRNVYFVNFITSSFLLEDFKQQWILVIGTMPVNRLPDLPLPLLNVIEKKEEDEPLQQVRWCDCHWIGG